MLKFTVRKLDVGEECKLLIEGSKPVYVMKSIGENFSYYQVTKAEYAHLPEIEVTTIPTSNLTDENREVMIANVYLTCGYEAKRLASICKVENGIVHFLFRAYPTLVKTSDDWLLCYAYVGIALQEI